MILNLKFIGDARIGYPIFNVSSIYQLVIKHSLLDYFLLKDDPNKLILTSRMAPVRSV